ncbi:zinc metalloprotease [Fulvivirgaceae bacterium PWU4]|uniref:Zinc metalloprotease n=1 Tax=Chryseosolibacter histidini TaxID=2782349 RepID=A0AAP2GN46_9BACT|nr:zinc metalloprotease [Chryseosolibacter histidini]MBT1696127.1 zinc metalloprotease [Chryseosolibacter histidini]
MQCRKALVTVLVLLSAWRTSNGQFNRICRADRHRVSPPELHVGRVQALKEDTGQEIAIPVVFHIVYNGIGQNITDQQLHAQLQVLNDDYNRKNPDSINTLAAFRPVAANCRISFFIAEKDAAGNPATGVTRTATTHGPFANDDIHFNSRGGHDAWDTRQFLNIWVCNLADGIFGYGSPPGTAEATDGVVIDYRYFGVTDTPPYNKGRTATHEIGHWLGLNHLWGDTGGCTSDDGIEDTPTQFGASTDCDLTRVSCGGLNMVQNYMDQSHDACMNLFTRGQRAVMRNNLFVHRSGVIHDKSLITGVAPEQHQLYVQVLNTNTLVVASTDPSAKICLIDVLGRTIPFTETQASEGARTLTLHGDVKGVCMVVLVQKGRRFVQRVMVD